MILVKPSFEVMEILGVVGGGLGAEALKLIEVAGRTCYKSESNITSESAKKFVQKITELGHESVIEHSAMTVRIICDRGVTHEIVRHRLCAFSQESTRYCNYKGGVTFVIPCWCVQIEEGEFTTDNLSAYGQAERWWFKQMLNLEGTYQDLLEFGWSPQQARSVLPNSTKTEIVITANFREWRHIFRLRCAKAAHPQMREIMIPLRDKCRDLVPVIFDDL